MDFLTTDSIENIIVIMTWQDKKNNK